MERVIDNLIGSYEKGTLSRRDLVAALAGLTITNSPASAAAAGFESSGINHVNIAVSDVQRSVEFYRRVFRLPVTTPNQAGGAVQLAVGKGQHISIQRSDARRGIDHFAIGIDRFNKETVIADLRARRATATEVGTAGLHVIDPDGINVQLSANQPA
jgi:catechol 2,3-dioxygenase-like lactoylglutathione lyase family enzyme